MCWQHTEYTWTNVAAVWRQMQKLNFILRLWDVSEYDICVVSGWHCWRQQHSWGVHPLQWAYTFRIVAAAHAHVATCSIIHTIFETAMNCANSNADFKWKLIAKSLHNRYLEPQSGFDRRDSKERGILGTAMLWERWMNFSHGWLRRDKIERGENCGSESSASANWGEREAGEGTGEKVSKVSRVSIKVNR